VKNTTITEILTVTGIVIILVGCIAIGIYDIQCGGITTKSPSRFRAEIDDLKARVERLEHQNK
jgi:hypothetical protein